MTRKYTSKLLDMISEGQVSQSEVFSACLHHMSEADVKEMMHDNEFYETCPMCGGPLELDSSGEWGPCEECTNTCPECDGDMDTDCFGKPRCPVCDDPCPGCCDQ